MFKTSDLFVWRRRRRSQYVSREFANIVKVVAGVLCPAAFLERRRERKDETFVAVCHKYSRRVLQEKRRHKLVKLQAFVQLLKRVGGK